MFLYRVVDAQGRTAPLVTEPNPRLISRSHLFFSRQVLKRHGEPVSITLDGFEPSHCALRHMGMRNEVNLFGPESGEDCRSSKYLNNNVEQDHRRIKVLGLSHVGLQVLRQRKNRTRRNRTHPETEEGPIWRAPQVRAVLSRHLEQSTYSLKNLGATTAI